MPKKEFRYLPLENKDNIFYYILDNSEIKYTVGFVTPDKFKALAENSRIRIQIGKPDYLVFPRLIVLKELTTSSIKKTLDEMNKNGTLERILKE